MKAVKSTIFSTKMGELKGNYETNITKLKAINNFLLRPSMNQLDVPIYKVEMANNGVKEGEVGGLFYGISKLWPGTVNEEFYFTRGHFHQKLNTGEYYWGITGRGLLLLRSINGDESIMEVTPGSINYIPGETAHRLINIGNDILSVGAVWQSNSGHQYSEKNIFETHVIRSDDTPGYKLVCQ